ncbi:MAG TPA: NADH-quinone oxidoreductase subunit N [Methanomassiliicoccales archaeon]|jgi:NADH-quinone oxidoreductase subunit N
MIDIQAIRPEIIVALFAVLVPAVGLLTKNSSKICAAFSLVGVGLAFLDVFMFVYNNNGAVSISGGMLSLDQFSALFMMIFLAVAFYVILASARFIQEDRHQPEFYSLIMIATIGMMIVASSNDLITLFVGIELTSITSYALVAFRKKDVKGAEAAVKYFIIGGLSSGLALFGISLLYGVAHSTTFTGVAQAVVMNSPMQPVIFLALIMIVAGFGFKVAIVPFHMWAPDVYEGAPTTVTAMLAGGSKKMGFIALFKVLLIGLFAIKSNWDVLIGIVAIATMTVGNLAAISQTNIKRMLAYSSIAQAGYILIALPVAAVSDPTIGQYALSAGIMQIMTHAFMKGGAFLIVATLATVAVGESISNYKGLAKRTPFMAFGMTVLLFSLAGIPPLAGFFSKFVLFSSPIDASSIPGNGWMVWLAIAAIVNSAISLYYYVRVVKYMYVDEAEEGTPTEKLKLPISMVAAVAICVFMVVLIGVWPDPFFNAAQHAAAAFFA